jgi:hypothetical protein
MKFLQAPHSSGMRLQADRKLLPGKSINYWGGAADPFGAIALKAQPGKR